MTLITDDPKVLKDYKDELEYYNEQHPEPKREPNALGKMSNALEKGISVLSKVANSNAVKKTDSFLRDLAEKQNGGGSDFNIQNMGRSFGNNNQNSDTIITRTIKKNGDIIITEKQGRKKKDNNMFAGEDDGMPLLRRGNF